MDLIKKYNWCRLMLHRLRERSVAGGWTGGIWTTHWWSYPEPDYFVGPGGWSIEDEYYKTSDFTEKKVREDGLLPPSDFWSFVVKRTVSGVTGSGLFHYENYPVERAASFTPTLPTLEGEKSDEEYALQLLEKSNPFNSVYSIPVAIKEMVELASMFKLTAESFASMVGGAYLNYKFGWVAFHNDLQTLYNITKEVEKRHKDLLMLYERGILRKRVYLDHKSAKGLTRVTANSGFGCWLEADEKFRQTLKVWGTVTWVLKVPDAPSLTKLEAWNLAVRQVLDLELPDAHTLWNLIPFSWLIDYFVDIDEFLGGTEGRVLAEPQDICIMRTYEQTYNGRCIPVVESYANYSAGPYSVSRVDKIRKVVDAGTLTPVFTWFLSKNQWMTILALIARFRG